MGYLLAKPNVDYSRLGDRELAVAWKELNADYFKLATDPTKNEEAAEMVKTAVPYFAEIAKRRKQTFRTGTYPNDALLLECLKQTSPNAVTVSEQRTEGVLKDKVSHLVMYQPDDMLLSFYQFYSPSRWYGYLRFGFTPENLPPGKALKDMPIDKVYWRVATADLGKYKKLHGLMDSEIEQLKENISHVYLYPIREAILFSTPLEPRIDLVTPMFLSSMNSTAHIPLKEIEPVPMQDLTRGFFRSCEDGELPSWDKHLRARWNEVNKFGTDDSITEAYHNLSCEFWSRGFAFNGSTEILLAAKPINPMHIGVEKITPEYLADLTKEDILFLHSRLHILYNKVKAEGGAVENTVNAHIFLLAEMKKRGMEHKNIGEIDTVSIRDNEKEIEPEEVVQDFYTHEPFAFLTERVGSNLKVSTRSLYRYGYFEDALRNLMNEGGERLHFLNDAGPSDSGTPIYSLGYFRNPKDNLKCKGKPKLSSPELLDRLQPIVEPAPCVWYLKAESDEVVYFILSNTGEPDKALEARLAEFSKGAGVTCKYGTEPPRGARPLLTRVWIPSPLSTLETLSTKRLDGDISAREDAVKLMRFFWPTKPEALGELIPQDEYPWYSSKKAKGLGVQIHKKGDNVKVWSEEGEDLTARFPSIVEKVQSLIETDFVFLAQIEWWGKGDAQIREPQALSNYIGSKRMFAEQIANAIPDDCKTIFDPMCGSGHVMMAAKKKGLSVFASDVNPVAAHFTRAALLGKTLPREDFEKILNAKPVSGWTTRQTRPPSIVKLGEKYRRYLDGVVVAAHSFSGWKKIAAVGLVADMLQMLQSNLSFASDPGKKKYTFEGTKRLLNTAWREMQRIQVDGPPGTVMLKGIENRDIPNVDVIYFDPPYDSTHISGDTDPMYSRYETLGGVMEQKDFHFPKLKFSKLPGFLARLAKEGRPKVFMVSSDSNSKTNYKKELEDLGFTVAIKKFKHTRPEMGAGPVNKRKGFRIPYESLYYAFRNKRHAAKLNADPDMIDVLDFEATQRVRNFPEEFVAAYAHAKGAPDDSEFVATIHDLVYCGGDIHNVPYSDRMTALHAFENIQSTDGQPDVSAKLNILPFHKAETPGELESNTLRVMNALGSEGNILKPGNSRYSIQPDSVVQYRYNKSTVVNGIVLGRKETDAEGFYVYDLGLRTSGVDIPASDRASVGSREFAHIGSTPALGEELKIGDPVRLECETLNASEYVDGTHAVSCRISRVLGKAEGVDTFDEAIEQARMDEVLIQKRYPETGSLPILLSLEAGDLKKDPKAYRPSELSDKNVSDDWNIATAWWTAIADGQDVGMDADTVIEVGRKIFRELVKRRKVSFPQEGVDGAGRDITAFLQQILKYESGRGIVLPTADLVSNKEKTAVVKSRPIEFDGFHALLGSDGKMYGWMRFGFTKENTPELLRSRVKVSPFVRIEGGEFDTLRLYHKISNEEKEEWWPGENTLYYHPVRDFIPLGEEKSINLPKDHRGFVRGMFVEDQVGCYEPPEPRQIETLKLATPEKAKALIMKWRGLSRRELAAINPSRLPEFFWQISNHYRGKSAHTDLRIVWQGKKNLEGFTIASQVKGAIKDPVVTLAEAAKISDPNNARYWKFRPNMEPTKSVQAFQKSAQPLEWATMVRSTTDEGKGDYAPGPGATENYPGVFWGCDWGMLWPGVIGKGRFGTSKPWFREFFLFGKEFKGRVVFVMRDDASKDQPIWSAKITKDQTPYILSRRALNEKEYLPPEGISGLPPQLEEKIPRDLQWWQPGIKSKEQAFEKIEAARKLLMDADILKPNMEYTLAEIV